MGLIIKSFIMSFGLTGRMILPSIGIFIVSMLVSGVLSTFTGGLAGILSVPVTSAFFALFGIRVALSMKGNHSRTEYKILTLYAFLYGIGFLIATGLIALLTAGTALLYASWQTGTGFSVTDYLRTSSPMQPDFAFHTVSAEMVVTLLLAAAVNALMAVPVASAARAAGSGAMSAGFFQGFGRSFVPMFCIFALVSVLQYFFGIFTLLFALAPIMMSVVTFVFSGSLPDIDLWVVLSGIAASVGYLWMNCWTYAAAALALGENSEAIAKKSAPPTPPRPTQMDIRSLRKSRETGA